MKIIKCVIYLLATGLLGFLAGRVIPPRWLMPEKGIFRSLPFEKEGKLYERIGIKKWQKKVPDMSRILPFMMPPKNLMGKYQNRLPLMIRETCKAELIHGLLCLTGLAVLFILPGPGGVLLYLVYAVVFNLPYILIQRYNRPRLVRLYEKLSAHHQKEGEAV